jgi:hypothetical protein
MEIGSARLVLVEWPWCFPCGTSFGRGIRFRRRCGTPVTGQESAAGLVRTALCKPEGDFRQTRSLTRVERSICLNIADRKGLQRRALNLGVANEGVGHSVPHPKCTRRRKIPKSHKLRPRTTPKKAFGDDAI